MEKRAVGDVLVTHVVLQRLAFAATSAFIGDLVGLGGALLYIIVAAFTIAAQNVMIFAARAVAAHFA